MCLGGGGVWERQGVGSHRRHNERELLRLPVALPVAPRRGVQLDESPSLRADDHLDVPAGGEGELSRKTSAGRHERARHADTYLSLLAARRTRRGRPSGRERAATLRSRGAIKLQGL